MLKAGGYASVREGDGTVSREGDTFTCGHKNCIVRVPPGFDAVRDVSAMCRGCMKLICVKCAEEAEQIMSKAGARYGCYNLEARLEDIEKNGARARRGGRWGTPIF